MTIYGGFPEDEGKRPQSIGKLLRAKAEKFVSHCPRLPSFAGVAGEVGGR